MTVVLDIFQGLTYIKINSVAGRSKTNDASCIGADFQVKLNNSPVSSQTTVSSQKEMRSSSPKVF